MSLLLVEIPLAIFAFRRGWRGAPACLLALPLAVLAFEPSVAAALQPLLGDYFDPAGTARALAHGAALLGLVVTAIVEPTEGLAAGRRPAEKTRRTGPLYQI